MAQLITIFWRDIPSQLIARAGRKRSKVLLPDRFQKAIDRAAMRAKKTSADAYLDDWRRETKACDADLEAALEAASSAIEHDYSDQVLDILARNFGLQAAKDES